MNKRIVIIGNSVALRIRPKEQGEKVYSQLLDDLLNKDRKQWEVINFGLSRMLTTEYVKYKDEYIREFPTYYIINLGCVDAPNRDIPLWYANIIFYRSSLWAHSFFNSMYRNILQKFSPLLVKLRFNSPWVKPSKFRNKLEFILAQLKKETNASIILLGINAGNAELEKRLPGTLARYEQYNTILREVSDFNQCDFIDVSDLNTLNHFPDGVHYNGYGHQVIANRLAAIIDNG